VSKKPAYIDEGWTPLYNTVLALSGSKTLQGWRAFLYDG